jgi:hypothetical protein
MQKTGWIDARQESTPLPDRGGEGEETAARHRFSGMVRQPGGRGSSESGAKARALQTLSRGTKLSQFGRFAYLCSGWLAFARITAGKFFYRLRVLGGAYLPTYLRGRRIANPRYGHECPVVMGIEHIFV